MARIVVGVDGSPGGQAALRFAIDEARLRSATLHAVHAWTLPLSESVPGPFLLELPEAAGTALEEARSSLREHAERLLEEALRDALDGGEGGIDVRAEAVEAAPARALLERAAGAELLVVGSRGRGGFRGLLLGSVGQQCAHHAPCPVVVVRASAGGSPP